MVIRHKEGFFVICFKNFPNVLSDVFVRFEKFQPNFRVPSFIPEFDLEVQRGPVYSYSLLSPAACLDQIHRNFILVNLLSNPQKSHMKGEKI